MLSVVAAAGLFVALASWALSAPVGAAPDDTYHLPTIWCSWGEHETCKRDGNGSFRTPEVISEVCTYQRPMVSASCEYLRTEELVTAGHLLYVGSDQVLLGNSLFHRALRIFVGPESEQSSINMRISNVALAALMLLWAMVVSSPGARRALGLTWLVAIVPVGTFIMSSTNPSGWVIVGVGTYWAFLLAVLRPGGRSQLQRSSALVGAVVSAIIAIGARTDALVFIGGSTVAVTILAWPRIRDARGVKVGLALLAALILVLVATTPMRNRVLIVLNRIGDSPDADSRLTEDGLDPTLNHLLELPSYLWALMGGQAPTFVFPTAYLRGLGWLDTSVPSVVGIFALCAVVAVLVWGMGVYGGRKVAATLIAFLTLALSVLVPLEGINYAPTFVTQPRYVLPMLLVVIGIAALRPLRSGCPRMAMTVVVVVLMTIANATAQLASLHRYTNGESLPWMRLDMEPNWWWLGAPVGPTSVWVAGSVGFAIFACAVGLIARIGNVGRVRKAVEQTFEGVEADYLR